MVDYNQHRKEIRPPRIADWFLKWFCKPGLLEAIEGDLLEQYRMDRMEKPKWKANLTYYIHVINFLRPFAIKKNSQNSNTTIMYRHYFSFALRNIGKHKQTTAINVLSLGIGIACFLFTFIYVQDEMGYDKFHSDHDKIYRIVIDFVDDNGTRLPDATTPPAVAPALKNEFPEVADATRVFPMWGNSFLMGTNEDKLYKEENVMRVDSFFFKVFDFEMMLGDKNTALDQPNNIIVTESMARKYFGDKPSMGESIIVESRRGKEEFIVSGIMKDVPYNSHFSFDFLMPLRFDGIDENWGWYNYYTYLKLKEQASIAELEPKLQPMYNRHNDLDEDDNPNIIYSQPITDIHLKSDLKWELAANGDMENIYFFSALGIFVLLISFINYLNLTIAKTFKRSKEVGVRKTFGAHKKSIINQIVVESFMVIIMALGLGTLFAELMFDGFASLMGKELSILQPMHLPFYLLLAGCTLLMGALAGLYPALHMSSFRITNIIKGVVTKAGKSVVSIRKSLLVVQFVFSAIMIVGTVTVYQQLKHFRQTDMGFDKDQVLILPSPSSPTNQQAFKNSLLQSSEVKKVGMSIGVMGGLNWTTSAGYPSPVLLNYTLIDTDYINTMSFELIAGRNFSAEIPSDTIGYTIIVNEKGLKDLGQDLSSIGQPFPILERDDSLTMGTIIGVVKDFHFTSFKNEIKPYAFFYRNTEYDNTAIKLSSSNIPASIAAVEKVWNQFYPSQPFDYYFLDDSIASLYKSEDKLSTILFDLTVLAIFIAFVGMFSIINLVIKDRIKEIAIRKVLGAQLRGLVFLIVKNFMVIVAIANIIALPLAYFIMENWLNGFAYRMNFNPWIYLGSGALTFLIALLAIGYQSYKAAQRSMTESLSYE